MGGRASDSTSCLARHRLGSTYHSCSCLEPEAQAFFTMRDLATPSCSMGRRTKEPYQGKGVMYSFPCPRFRLFLKSRVKKLTRTRIERDDPERLVEKARATPRTTFDKLRR